MEKTAGTICFPRECPGAGTEITRVISKTQTPEPESFCEYLGVEEEGPEKPCGDLCEEIRDLYGHICYACGSTENITVDHIVPKSMDGQAVVPKRLILALDFLKRPAPWDSNEGLIW